MKKSSVRDILALPNILSYFRILLIPEFIWLYLSGNRYPALAVLVLSAASDFLDGRAARCLGQVTPLGRVLDPVADKMTQLAVLGCLAVEYGAVRYLLMILIVKEAGAAAAGAVLLASGGEPFNSRWYGKLSTGMLYGLCGLLLTGVLNDFTVGALCVLTSCAVMFSLLMYATEFGRRILSSGSVRRRKR